MRCHEAATQRYGSPLMSPNVPEKPSLAGLEAKWADRWEADGTYRFDRSKSRAEIYAIDTPPPTVSGSLHIGHVMSYTHTDRSEERRVGKECRSRWSPYPYRRKENNECR